MPLRRDMTWSVDWSLLAGTVPPAQAGLHCRNRKCYNTLSIKYMLKAALLDMIYTRSSSPRNYGSTVLAPMLNSATISTSPSPNISSTHALIGLSTSGGPETIYSDGSLAWKCPRIQQTILGHYNYSGTCEPPSGPEPTQKQNMMRRSPVHLILMPHKSPG